MKKAYLSIILTLLMVASVSAFSFQDVLAGSLSDMVSGRASILNSLPKTNLNVPTDGQVISGTKLKVAWSYFDKDGNEQTAYFIQLSFETRAFDNPLNLGGVGSATSDIMDVRKGGEYYVRVRTKDAYGWGDWSEIRRIYIDKEAKYCDDGTPFWRCANKAPLYCNGGVLVDKCNICGCPANQNCVMTSGICVKQTCKDGTEYGACSANKPYYCVNGELKQICSLCECSGNRLCTVEGTCGDTLMVIVEENPQERSILGRVALFFKGMFSGLFK